VDGAYKDVKNMQQFYDTKRVFNIAGRSGAQIEYDPKKIRDVEFDLSITESTSTPAYRHLANDMLMQLYQSQAISVEQLLEHGDFPFADELLQSIKSQKEQLAQGRVPDGLSPQLLQQAQQNANMEAVNQLHGAMQG
jgi:excinuclease UvrABC nuclease subunit